MNPQPSLLIALLLTLFLPGAGHIYLGRYAKGVTILILFWTGLAIVIGGALGIDYHFRLGDRMIGFRVSPLTMKIYFAEILIVFLYNFVDCIRLIPVRAEAETTAQERPLYHLTLAKTGADTPPMRRAIMLREIILGRSPGADVRLNDPAVSRQHARIYQQGVRFVIEDLNSTNGTRVNGELIRQRPLRSGDVIELGNHRIQFHPSPPQR